MYGGYWWTYTVDTVVDTSGERKVPVQFDGSRSTRTCRCQCNDGVIGKFHCDTRAVPVIVLLYHRVMAVRLRVHLNERNLAALK